MDASLLDDFSIRLRWFQSGESTIIFSPLSGHEYSIEGELRVPPVSFSSSFRSFCYANDLVRFRDELVTLVDGSGSTAVFESVDFDVQLSISQSEGQHVSRVSYQSYADPVRLEMDLGLARDLRGTHRCITESLDLLQMDCRPLCEIDGI